MALRSVRARLLGILVAFTLVGLIATSTPFLVTNALLGELRDAEAASLQATTDHGRLAEALVDREVGLRGYLLTGDPASLEPYHDGVRVTQQAAAALGEHAVTQPEIGPALDALLETVERWEREVAQPLILGVAAGETERFTTDARLALARHDFDLVRRRVADLGAAVGRPDTALAERVASITAFRTALFVTSTALFALTLVLSSLAIRRWIDRPLARLVRTAERVVVGEDVTFDASGTEEMAALGSALERMRSTLRVEQVVAERNATESATVNRLTEVAPFLEDDEALGRAALEALELVVAPDIGVLHVLDAARDHVTLVRPLAAGTPGEAPPDPAMLDRCLGLRRGSMVVADDLSAPLSPHCALVDEADGTLVCLPLEANGEGLGTLHLWWARPAALPLASRGTVARIVEHLALTLGSRRLVAKLRGIAGTDARTGLANSRSFDDVLDSHLADRAEGTSLALLLLDLDHFKAFNDEHGHPAGDEALRTFAGVLRACLRDGDVAARYGGEEFVVLLPGLDAAAAAAIAERIRTRLEATVIQVGGGGVDRITVSAGVAVAPTDGADRVALVAAADAALYAAKDAGRNTVRVSGTSPATSSPRRLRAAARARTARAG